ncbi:GNAT family N-acetyltransferase [Oscillochloris sp. ZM17-4]|uniref:GNAT family N-acetyltransferase n=1 Tax=Oscillochloris sp. ZM17-4 TaxID=2866714 RepID=UPI001C730256|nr:GNAT family N-acetyltransferase [Oscillochloris sp. ZM17-4]MBX0328523.1 GNAT family N-acetyltransferase [Oscillochloris sp. ZM17-4]
MPDDIALIEELAANAVPAAMIQEIDGWRLRYNGGVTRRANSVLAAHDARWTGLQERLSLTEAFYASYGQPCRFQLCPASRPVGLADLLLARGYRATPATYVQVGPLGPMRARAAGRAQVSEVLDDDWLAAYIEGEGETDPVKIAVRREMLQRITPRTGFAAITEGDQIAAVALGVVERGCLGVFNVATRPAFRRRGLAHALLGDLTAWAEKCGAVRGYLQAYSINQPALALYAGLGFRTLYQYTYYEKEVA